MPYPYPNAECLCLSPDDLLLAIGGGLKQVLLFNVIDGTLLQLYHTLGLFGRGNFSPNAIVINLPRLADSPTESSFPYSIPTFSSVNSVPAASGLAKGCNVVVTEDSECLQVYRRCWKVRVMIIILK